MMMNPRPRRPQPKSGPASELPRLRRALLAWYRRHARPLPWRETSDPYRIWLSEVMLQQTRVETVIPYYQRFVAAFPDVAALAAAPLDRVLKLWEGLGYYSRARNLHRAAQVVIARPNGRFPQSAAELAELPGVGRYTAAAIASIAYGEPVAALDGNIKRVLARLFRVREPVQTPAATDRLWALAEACLSRRSPGDWNQALMELGATVCTPRRPRCTACPIRAFCTAHAAGEQDALPLRTARKSVPHRDVAAAVVLDAGRLLLVRRPERGLLGGLWELPQVGTNGATSSEDYAGALAAHVRLISGRRCRVGRQVAEVDHAFTHFTLCVRAYRCNLARPTNHADVNGVSVGVCWATTADLERLALPRADRKVLEAIRCAAVSNDAAGLAPASRRRVALSPASGARENTLPTSQ